MNADAKELFAECFEATQEEADIIMGYAEKHGHIDILYQDGTAVNMICQSTLSADGNGILYLFACCTKKEHRKKGLFRKQLDSIIGNRRAMLIPENESLFPMYEGLGFSPIYHLEAEIAGNCTAEGFDGIIDELYEIYKKSFPTPKKDLYLFESTIKAFLLYGGKIMRYKSTAMLVSDGKITDIYASDENAAVEAAINCLDGNYKAIFPYSCREMLDRQGIKYDIKSLALSKNVGKAQAEQIYINNLFN